MGWKVVGKLHMPKYITKGLNSPQFVQNTAFYLFSSLILTLLYPYQISNFVKY